MFRAEEEMFAVSRAQSKNHAHMDCVHSIDTSRQYHGLESREPREAVYKAQALREHPGMILSNLLRVLGLIHNLPQAPFQSQSLHIQQILRSAVVSVCKPVIHLKAILL